MMKKQNRIIIWIFVIIVLIIATSVWFLMSRGNVVVMTDKTEYGTGDTLQVKIKNRFWTNISFSLCYPYFLERKNGEWEIYDYIDCQKFNGSDYNIHALRGKMFELTLPNVPDGAHRLRIPVCVGCKSGDIFRADKIFYSNEFRIKQ